MKRYKFCTITSSNDGDRWFALFSDLVEKPTLTKHEVRGTYESKDRALEGARKYTQPKRGTIWLLTGSELMKGHTWEKL